MENTQTSIPTGPTFETALDRLKRASNFASNGEYMAAHDTESATRAKTIQLFAWSARAMLDEAEAAMVGAWRAEGATWDQIGGLFGITRQAAQQRFGR